MSTEKYRRMRILHVEDNIGDVRLIAEALRETGRDHEIAVAFDGVEALDYLYRRGRYVEAWRPDLILLDLNLPKKGGLEVLAEIKADEEFRQIPVVVLTSSSAPQDISQACALNVSRYVTKPAELGELFNVVGELEKYWANVANLPPRPGAQDEAVR
jgi:chemotaxis family two-component system response regulator Rcp1